MHTITKQNKKNLLSIPIIDVKYPPSAGLKNKDFDSHDLAILVLKNPLEYSSTIRPICLPEPGEEFYGRSVTAAGWGMTDKDSGQSKVLNVVQLRVSEKRYKHHKMFGTELSMFENEYRDPCSGDSGKGIFGKTKIYKTGKMLSKAKNIRASINYPVPIQIK